MSSQPFTPDDLEQMALIGIAPDRVTAQLKQFETGFPYITLERPCLPGDGIERIEPETHARLVDKANLAAKTGRFCKFIPASGAATRMFKSLMAVQYDRHIQQDPQHPDHRFLNEFLTHLDRFAFYDELRSVMQKKGHDIDALRKTHQYSEILSFLLNEIGLNYAHWPKALLLFHRYPEGARTALEEHLVEALHYSCDADRTARIHATVSSEHVESVESFVRTIRTRYEKAGNKLAIAFSIQKPSTDTIAVDLENQPFRDRFGRLVFRPAGHGALIENINDLNGDLIFIKNIDNVVPDRLKETTYLYKKLLAGHLITLQEKTFGFVRKLSEPSITAADLAAAAEFAERTFAVRIVAPAPTLHEKLFQALNRPIRVCGMVPNQGEPGGGPFWVKNEDGSISKQIVEKTQIDLNWPSQRYILEKATHFNPVDIVCGVRDHHGKPFDLRNFTDPATGFISKKSKDGRELKAMELPGLWNGGMARWLTAFVEVPLATFNPVKTVNDLLRSEHQN